MSMVRVGVLTIMLVVLAGLPRAGAEDLAQTYNLKGMAAYRQFNWKAAEEWFRKAIKEDPNHKLANYNLACVLSLRLTRDHFSWHIEQGSWDDPLEQLARAIAVEPTVAQKAAHDPDFMNVRLTPRFQMLIGADLTDPKLVELLLVAQGEWYGPECGSWCGTDLLFFEDGEVQKKILVLDESDHRGFKYEVGHYSVKGGVITVQFGTDAPIEGSFTRSGFAPGSLQLGNDVYTIVPGYDI